MKHVVIVGGGIAGLAAAETITRMNRRLPAAVRVTLLESRRATGGRAGSFTTLQDGRTVTADYCQHVTMGCCTNLLSLLRRTSLIDQWERYSSLTFYHPEHGFMPWRPSRFPPPLHLAGAFGGLRFLTSVQQRQIAMAMWKLFRIREAELVDVTAEQWLIAAGQDETTRRTFWDVILISALGDVCEQVSMAAARKVMVDGFAAARDAGDVYVPRRPLSAIFGESLPRVLAQNGVEIRTGEPVRDINVLPDQNSITVRLRNDVEIQPDRVIVATPWHATRRWLESTGVQPLDVNHHVIQIQNSEWLTSSPITGIHLWLDRPLTDLPHVVMVGTASQWLFREPLDQNLEDCQSDAPAAGCYHQVVISGRHQITQADNATCVRTVMAELNAAFPEAGGAECLKSRVVTDPHSVFSVSPESFRQRPICITSHPQIFLAGDWVQTGWPATMESAVIGGTLAANAALGRGTEDAGLLAAPLRRGWLADRLIRH